MTKAEVITLIDEYLSQKIANDSTANKEAGTIEKEQISEVIEAFFDVIKTSMEKGENVYMRGFGSFVNKKRARKVARNIKAKKSMVVEPHFIPSFKPAKIFMDKIKNSSALKEVLKREDNA
jgi:DNA-binding protein HU-beta